ncbi:MAG: mechanosensitive ion channel family protein [Parvularculaceae bacterium]
MESLQAFWDQIVDVWESGFLGQPVGKGLIALAILLVFYLLRKFIAHVLAGFLRRLAKRSKTDWDDALVGAIEQPLALAPIAAGVFFAGEALGLGGDSEILIQKLTQSILIFALFWAFYGLVRPFAALLKPLERMFGDTLIDWLVKILKILFVIIGAAAILDLWGVPVLPFLASLSLLSVAVALGAQDLFKNLIAGALIIAERRFGSGDWIKVDGVVEGTVEQVSFRSTKVRRFDKAPVHVPNAQLSDNSVVNFSRMTHRRIYWVIGVEYRTTVDQLAKIRNEIEEYILGSDDFAKPPEVTTFVRIDQFSDSSIDIMLYCFTKTTNWVEWLTIKETLAYRIKEIVESAGTGFAFPSQSVYVETLPEGERPEPFEPPKESKEKLTIE